MRRLALRIACWVLAGAAVTCFWVLFAVLAHPRPDWGHWTIVEITVPASLFWRHGPVSYYTVIFLNAVIYGLAGLALEPLFQIRRPPASAGLPAR